MGRYSEANEQERQRSDELTAAAVEFMDAAADIGEQLASGKIVVETAKASFARCRATMDKIERSHFGC